MGRDQVSSVSPKGQITIPLEVRRRLGIQPKDKVQFSVDGEEVRISRAKARVDLSYRVIPALAQPLSDQEMTDIAWEEHSQHVAREGA